MKDERKAFVFTSSFILHPSSFLSPLPFDQLTHGFDRVYFLDSFIVAQAQDAWEAQGVAALVPFRFLHAIKGHFEDDERLDNADFPMREFLYGVGAKPFGQLGQLHIGEARICFADVEKLTILFRAPHGEGVIREQVTTLAVSDLDACDDDIERRHGAFEFQPLSPAPVAKAGGNHTST